MFLGTSEVSTCQKVKENRPRKMDKTGAENERNMNTLIITFEGKERNMKKEISQEQELLALMEKVPTVTVQYISHKLKLNSPRKVISDLKKKGVPIKDRWISHMDAYGGVTRYKEYWLEENDHANVL